MISTHDWHLVALSILIAIITSYTALDLAGRVTAANGRLRQAWLVGGAVTLGVGIWSMHFIAMFAFSLPIPIAYHAPTLLVAMLVAIVASGAALFVASRRVLGTFPLLAGGISMGLGIASMHYTGMAAMRMHAITRYDPMLVTLSVVIAIGTSLAALRLAFKLRGETTAIGNWQKTGSAILMGGAIAGMHYTAMAAATFTPFHTPEAHWGPTIGTSMLGAVAITVATFLVLSLALLTSLVDRRFAEALRQSEARFHSLYETGQALVSNLEVEPLLQTITDTARELLKARICGLLVLGEGPDHYEYVKVSGPPSRPDWLLADSGALRIPYKEGICLRLDDIATHPLSVDLPHTDPSIRAFLGVPLQIKSRALGTLFVGRGPEDGNFSHDDENLLLAFANQAAIALENARLYERQKQNLIRLQELSHELNKAHESRLLTEERNRIAQELHDQVAQVLFSIGLKANRCLEQLSPDSEIYKAIQVIQRWAGESTAHIRDAIYRLSRPGNGEGRLLNVLRNLVGEFKDSTGIDSDLVVAGEPSPLPEKVEEALYRVAKEALANVTKHSRAKVVVVSLRFSPQEITLAIQDDGIGLPHRVIETYRESVTHFGLKGMHRLIEDLGGQFHIRNGDEARLIITATMPLDGVG